MKFGLVIPISWVRIDGRGVAREAANVISLFSSLAKLYESQLPFCPSTGWCYVSTPFLGVLYPGLRLPFRLYCVFDPKRVHAQTISISFSSLSPTDALVRQLPTWFHRLFRLDWSEDTLGIRLRHRSLNAWILLSVSAESVHISHPCKAVYFGTAFTSLTLTSLKYSCSPVWVWWEYPLQ